MWSWYVSPVTSSSLSSDLTQQVRHLLGDVIAHGAEEGHHFVVRAGGLGRIGEAEVDTLALPSPSRWSGDRQPHRTLLRRRVAHRHHEIERHGAEFVGVLGAPVVFNADFVEDAQGIGVDVTGRFRPGADGFPLVAHPGVDDGLGHLRAAGVSSAEEEDFAFHYGAPLGGEPMAGASMTMACSAASFSAYGGSSSGGQSAICFCEAASLSANVKQ